ncbi:TonB-linked outer membrane protein, SusC/RagA family [Hymenobacter gelipurpurascens]|uniref:TonB-linked outer membrane protein, SusC/RagA family n=1 Tax=Hymenobacter gelipurpurascens TaxID=89968 RepID=A0A212UHG8_9BACT|nr:TonB-dependent receptor [Hymenobacter gelipurpurascens]SNC77687.1 TonB-linked outer membrane protein, SusC/RagA family [Hymenobacter gelipurpurascens]
MHTRTLLLLPLALGASFAAHAQTRQVSGTVLSAGDRSPLPGVSVVIKGTTTGTSTDGDGKFTLPVPADSNPTLVMSFVGFEPMEVKVGSDGTLPAVQLKEKSTNLNEVVVVGYGSQRKRDITGSVASISAEQVAETPIARADQILQGRVSGVQVTQTNSEPGGNVSIRIRGTNSINTGNEPLFVVDGFPGAGDLNSINPSDIESIEVLKDASATAIYGSRGANGVVLITTKKGKVGKGTVNFEAYTGVQIVRHKYELMNAKEFATYLNDVNSGSTTLPQPYTQEQIDELGEGTDWQSEILRRARMSNYQLGFNGGTEETRYNLSFNYFDQEGIILNSGFQRGTVRLNLDKKISSKLNFNFSSQLAGTFEKRAFVNSQGGSFGGALLDALRFSPINPVRDANGEYTYSNTPLPYVEDVGNPVAFAMKTKDQRTVARGLVNVAANYELMPGLTLRISGGLDYNNQQTNVYRPSDVFLGRLTGGSANRAQTNRYSWLNENTLTYDKKIDENNALNAVVGLSEQQFYGNDFSSAANNFFTNTLGSDNLALGANIQTPNSGRYTNTLASYFGRVNYRLFEKYLFTVTMRADGSSRFGRNNKWGYFPSAAFAYRLIDEKFMSGFTFLSDLKLRLGYGITGNQEINNYQSLARYDVGSYAAGSTRLVGLVPANILNPDLRWESTAASNVGIDVAFLENRISVTADAYYKKTTDLLLRVATPRTTGYGDILLNAGSVENKGFEFALNTTNFDNKKFSWKTNLNFSLNRNKVLDLYSVSELPVGQSSSSLFVGAGLGNTSILREGEPIGSFYGYQFGGIWQTQEEITASGTKTAVRPGDPRYIDQNGDGQITAADRVIIGRAQPKFIYGLTNGFTYGGFNLSVFIQGVQGSDVLNLNRYELESGITTTNKLKTVVDRWTPTNPSNTIPRAGSTIRRSTGIVSDVIEDGSFVRLKTVTLGYSLPKFSTVVKSASVYVTAQNLVTLTKYTGYDPEVNSFGRDNLSLNTDYNAFPSTRTFIAGVRIGF